MTKHINEVHKNSPIKNVANKVVDHEIVIQHKEEIQNNETLEIIKQEVDLDLLQNICKKNPEGKCENCQEIILPIDLDLHMKNCKIYSKFMKKSDCFSGYKCQLCFFTTSLLKIGNNTWNDLRNSMYNHIRQNHRFNVQFLSKKFDSFENKNNHKKLFSKSQEHQEIPTMSTTKRIFDFIEADANYIKVEANQFEEFLTEENSFSNSIKQEPFEFDDAMVENKNSETGHTIAEPEIVIKVGSSESENLIFGKIKNEPIDDDVSSVSSNNSETGTSESETSTGKSFSEALILPSTKPHYNKRLFIELQVQYILENCKLRTCSEHAQKMLRTCSERAQNMLGTCSEHAQNMLRTCSEHAVYIDCS